MYWKMIIGTYLRTGIFKSAKLYRDHRNMTIYRISKEERKSLRSKFTRDFSLFFLSLFSFSFSFVFEEYREWRKMWESLIVRSVRGFYTLDIILKRASIRDERLLLILLRIIHFWPFLCQPTCTDTPRYICIWISLHRSNNDRYYKIKSFTPTSVCIICSPLSLSLRNIVYVHSIPRYTSVSASTSSTSSR